MTSRDLTGEAPTPVNARERLRSPPPFVNVLVSVFSAQEAGVEVPPRQES